MREWPQAGQDGESGGDEGCDLKRKPGPKREVEAGEGQRRCQEEDPVAGEDVVAEVRSEGRQGDCEDSSVGPPSPPGHVGQNSSSDQREEHRVSQPPFDRIPQCGEQVVYIDQDAFPASQHCQSNVSRNEDGGQPEQDVSRDFREQTGEGVLVIVDGRNRVRETDRAPGERHQGEQGGQAR